MSSSHMSHQTVFSDEGPAAHLAGDWVLLFVDVFVNFKRGFN